MRRFIFTSHLYKGFVEAIYNVNGIIWKISFANAIDMNNDQIKWFKITIPVLIENMESQFAAASSVRIEEKDFEVSFDDFKREYPYKRNTHLALKTWNTLTSQKQYAAFMSAIAYRKFLQRKENAWQKPMLPDRFLKEEQWKNDWDNI